MERRDIKSVKRRGKTKANEDEIKRGEGMKRRDERMEEKERDAGIYGEDKEKMENAKSEDKMFYKIWEITSRNVIEKM